MVSEKISLELWRTGFLAMLLALSLIGTQAHAQFNLGAAEAVGLPAGLEEILANIISAALGLVGVIALTFLVYGGFLYITGGGEGDEKKVGRAKVVITNAIIGIIVIGLAYAIVQFVIGFFQQGGGAAGGG